MSPPLTIIIRHKKENLKKCSLRGLEKREDFIFFSYPLLTLPLLENYVVLAQDAPTLSEADKSKGLCLIDATWRYADKMIEKLALPEGIYRSLPKEVCSAYPRKQTDCPDPKTGLASIEALFVAFTLLQRDTKGLLDQYYWQNHFLEKNHSFFFNLKKEMGYS